MAVLSTLLVLGLVLINTHTTWTHGLGSALLLTYSVLMVVELARERRTQC